MRFCDYCHEPYTIPIPSGITGRFLHSKCYTEQEQIKNEENIRRDVLGARRGRGSNRNCAEKEMRNG